MPFYISPLWCGDFIAARQSCRWVGCWMDMGVLHYWRWCGQCATGNRPNLTNGAWSGPPPPASPQTIFLNFENEVIEATKAVISVLHRPMCPISRTPTTNTNSSGPPKKENVRGATAFSFQQSNMLGQTNWSKPHKFIFCLLQSSPRENLPRFSRQPTSFLSSLSLSPT